MNVRGQILEEVNHVVRRGFRSDVNAKLDNILQLVDEINKNKSTDIQFDNSYPNHYTLTYNGEKFEFNTYDSLKSALLLISKL